MSRDAFSGPGTYHAKPMPSVLSIAGSDPTGGAGIQADCQVLAAFGVHAAAVPTALTIQDGLGKLQGSLRDTTAVTLYGSEAVLRAAIESTARRDSGLAARL